MPKLKMNSSVSILIKKKQKRNSFVNILYKKWKFVLKKYVYVSWNGNSNEDVLTCNEIIIIKKKNKNSPTSGLCSPDK